MPGVTVELKHINKSFGNVEVLKDLCISVKRGELVTLLGPSGCGKTTTLNLVAGFESPDAGSIFVDNKLVNHVPPHKRNLGMVFQSYALFPHMNVFGNIAFGLEVRKFDKETVKEKIKRSLELVHLSGYEERYPRKLSGGEQQRVALARALVIEPKVLLLDEPLSNLDAKLRKEMEIEIRRIQKEVGVTTIFVTHDQEEAFTLSDRVAVMHDKKIQQIASPYEVYSEPETEFIAKFTRVLNLFNGVVRQVSESEVIVCLDEGPLICMKGKKNLREEDRVNVGIRPEKVVITKKKPTSTKNVFEGRVEKKLFLGPTIGFDIRMNHTTFTSRLSNVGYSTKINIGDKIYFKLKPEDWIFIRR